MFFFKIDLSDVYRRGILAVCVVSVSPSLFLSHPFPFRRFVSSDDSLPRRTRQRSSGPLLFPEGTGIGNSFAGAVNRPNLILNSSKLNFISPPSDPTRDVSLPPRRASALGPDPIQRSPESPGDLCATRDTLPGVSSPRRPSPVDDQTDQYSSCRV